MRTPVSLRSAGSAFVGPVLWAVHFLAVYASESLLCRAGPPGWHDVLVAGTTFGILLALAWHGLAWQRHRQRSGAESGLAGIAISLDAISILAVCYVAMAAALPACLRH